MQQNREHNGWPVFQALVSGITVSIYSIYRDILSNDKRNGMAVLASFSPNLSYCYLLMRGAA